MDMIDIQQYEELIFDRAVLELVNVQIFKAKNQHIEAESCLAYVKMLKVNPMLVGFDMLYLMHVVEAEAEFRVGNHDNAFDLLYKALIIIRNNFNSFGEAEIWKFLDRFALAHMEMQNLDLAVGLLLEVNEPYAVNQGTTQKFWCILDLARIYVMDLEFDRASELFNLIIGSSKAEEIQKGMALMEMGKLYEEGQLAIKEPRGEQLRMSGESYKGALISYRRAKNFDGIRRSLYCLSLIQEEGRNITLGLLKEALIYAEKTKDTGAISVLDAKIGDIEKMLNAVGVVQYV